LHIGVGAGKFLRVRRISAQISPNLPKTNCKENDLQKLKKKLLYFTGRIFSKQGTSSTIFAQISPKLAQISPNFSEKNYIKT